MYADETIMYVLAKSLHRVAETLSNEEGGNISMALK